MIKYNKVITWLEVRTGLEKTSFLPNRLLKEEISSLDRCLDNPRLHELTDGTEVYLKFGYKLLEIIEVQKRAYRKLQDLKWRKTKTSGYVQTHMRSRVNPFRPT